MPQTVDFDTPSAARIYDYWLGGAHNFAVDREAARAVTDAVPTAPAIAQANRAFLHRAVRWLTDQGIRQFLDIGSGIPTGGNVHEVAQRAAPDSRVVYVDLDPIAVAHSREILACDDRAVAIEEDLRRPAAILAHPKLRAVLDLDRPVGLLLVSVLHFVPATDDPYGAVQHLRDALAPGSFLALTHGAVDGFDRAAAATTKQIYQSTSGPTGELRTREQIQAFFGDFDLVEPGLVWMSQWRPDQGAEAGRPDGHPERSAFLAGVARKPAPPRS
ncbi:SAM-dependent methyltransferase [Rugosimonospora acidiphila]|uniref:SAM-dependent methyltransferase n=1 Tax=Rugosimonospora acidiphila TaxID=556531 RepID=A0ABP9SS22_9ACTN